MRVAVDYSRLERACKASGISKPDLAEMCGYNKGWLYQCARQNSMMHETVLEKLAEILGVRPKYLELTDERIESGFYDGSEHNPRIKTQQLCWSCQNAVPNPKTGRGCSWSREFKPVKGWTAKLVTTRAYKNEDATTYKIRKCPEYIPDKEKSNEQR